MNRLRTAQAANIHLVAEVELLRQPNETVALGVDSADPDGICFIRYPTEVMAVTMTGASSLMRISNPFMVFIDLRCVLQI